MLTRVFQLGFAAALMFLPAAALAAQEQPEPETETTAQAPETAGQPQQTPPHDHAAMLAAAAKRWQFMWDGALFATVNYQGGSRGQNDFGAQNWLMVMGSRQLGRGTLGVSAMASLEPATIGAEGYSHIFQLGEAYKNLPVIDRQHPHDLFMQLEAGWRVPVRGTEFSIEGGPVGAPAFGPTAFMHRLSASENPIAPLTHHTFDSTHIAMGTVTAGVRRGPFTLEGSAFRGREPDEHRWDLDLGALDSHSARIAWRPGGGLEFQASRAFLHEPEQLEPGNQKRMNASGSWVRMQPGGGFTAVTVMAGRVTRTYSWTSALLAEGIHWFGQQAVYGRYEGTGLETEHLLFPKLIHPPHPGEFVDPLHSITMGGVRRLMASRGMDLAVGGDVTLYRVPARLQLTHGERPVSAHVFVRLRPLRTTAPVEHHH